MNGEYGASRHGSGSRGRLAVLVAGVGIAIAGCGGGDGDGEAGAAPPPPPAAGAAELPVEEPRGAPDEELAERGEELFQSRGCVACHYVGRGERLVGPDLLGVPDRRTFPWFYHMVTSPDSMIRNDPDARQLFAEYMTPMSDQNVQPDEVVALWEYLRHEAEEAAEEEPEDGGA